MTSDVRVVIHFDHSGKLAAEVERRAGLVVKKTATDIQAAAIQKMSGGKSGRVYKRGQKTHQASAPGEAPAIDSGDYAGSASDSPKMVGPTEAEVRFSAEHAALEEFGTKFIAPRPALGPAVEEAREGFMAAAEKVVDV